MCKCQIFFMVLLEQCKTLYVTVNATEERRVEVIPLHSRWEKFSCGSVVVVNWTIYIKEYNFLSPSHGTRVAFLCVLTVTFWPEMHLSTQEEKLFHLAL